MSRQYAVLSCIFLLSCVCPGIGQAGSFTLQKIVVAGEEAPQGGVFVGFEPLGINRDGVILFDALVQQEENFHGIYLARHMSLSRLVATGDRTPTGGTFIELSDMVLNNQNHVAFLASARGGTARAIFSTAGGGLHKVVAVRESIPGVGVLREFSDVAFNDTDAVAFVGRVEPGKIPRALFIVSAAAVRKVVAIGQATPMGGRLAQITSPSLNNAGAVAFVGTLHGGEAPAGLFVSSGAGIRKVTAVGDASPLGGKFTNLALPLLHENGDVVFWAALQGAPVPSGLFVARRGVLEKVVARGDQAPGGGRLAFIELSYAANHHGTIAFHAGLTGVPARAGIFLVTDGTVRSIARLGDATPVGHLSNSS